MREQRVDAGDGLLGILSVYLIFRFAILFRDGQDAERLERFERVGGFWVEHANTNGQIVHAIEERKKHCDTQQDSFCDSGCGSQEQFSLGDRITHRRH